MYLMKEGYYHELETVMQSIPNFSPRGHGGMVLKREMEDCIRGQPLDSYEEMMSVVMRAIRYKPLCSRMSRYLKRTGGKIVSYRNKNHKALFEEITAEADKKDYALLSALYLLSADYRLWAVVKHHIQNNKICFQDIRLNGIHEDGYTLYCVAKDLYLGTKHLSVSDLSDTNLIHAKLFGIICNGMAIRRFGMKAVWLVEGRKSL